ncbi:MAG: helix-turn-helix transcriptional regulator [Thauera sp.]|uniref:helix-turn-helix transcriptional regulator n=1 Tax=Thauera sp. JM12B12 TaxID=3142262 RepID=UPI0029C2C469|nr:helix-turn-helix transcriptional regulator [Thauera sp.]
MHAGAPAAPAACLNAREAAAFLQLNEKKLYELANSRELPAARVGGKWLFPRALLEEWLLEQAHGGALTDRLLITGSDDPLLAATVGALAPALGGEAFVAYSPTGTLAGLELLARRRASVCALHWGGVEHSAQQHAMLLRRFAPHRQWALVRLALREQGVILRRGLEVDGIETLAAFDYRWAMRQPGAGSAHFLASALASRGFAAADCSAVATAHTEREAAALVAREDADCAPGTRAAAAEFGLGFLALGWEAFDLALPRDVLFRRLFQDLLAAHGDARSQALANRLGGYDLSPLGRVLGLD